MLPRIRSFAIDCALIVGYEIPLRPAPANLAWLEAIDMQLFAHLEDPSKAHCCCVSLSGSCIMDLARESSDAG
jgi:hypothetical protein